MSWGQFPNEETVKIAAQMPRHRELMRAIGATQKGIRPPKPTKESKP